MNSRLSTCDANPKGLAGDLRADDALANDNEGKLSLSEKGFYLV